MPAVALGRVEKVLPGLPGYPDDGGEQATHYTVAA